MSALGKDEYEDTLPFHLEHPCRNLQSPCYIKERRDTICLGHNEKIDKKCFDLWFADKENVECPADCKGVSEESLGLIPSELQLLKLSEQLTMEMTKYIAVHLGLKLYEWDNIEHDHGRHPENIKFISLIEGRKKKTETSLGDIQDVLTENAQDPHILCKMTRDKNLKTVIPFEVLDRVPTDKDLDEIAKYISIDSLHFTIELGMEVQRWLDFKKEYPDNIVKLNRTVLGTWRQEHPGRKKIHDLAQALCNVGKNIDHLIDNL